MPEISVKFKSNPTKTNNLIYIMMVGIYFSRRGGKKISRGGQKILILKIYPPYRILLSAPVDPVLKIYETFYKQAEIICNL